MACVACSDNNDNNCDNEVDKVLTDFDKPYSTLSSDELINIMEKNISACRDFILGIFDNINNDENNDYENKDKIEAYFYYCKIPIDNIPKDLKPTINIWNKDKKAFDILENTKGYTEYYFPSSITDDSRNELYAVVKYLVHPVCDTSRVDLYFGEDWIYTGEIQRNNTTKKIISKFGPYTLSMMESNIEREFELFVQKEGECSYLSSSWNEDGDLIMLDEFNNLRIWRRIRQIKNIEVIANKVLDRNDESYNKIMTELYNENMIDAVVVFTDRDEKIGDLTMVSYNKHLNKSIYGCKMQDGSVFTFTFDFY